ncbi:hypothetical protein MJO29_007095 [Puccinia striiformis f. sp. tritici]|nr:hypothetical protein MJO29_007095 [Puccinia striiformis f. sp. tritici]
MAGGEAWALEVTGGSSISVVVARDLFGKKRSTQLYWKAWDVLQMWMYWPWQSTLNSPYGTLKLFCQFKALQFLQERETPIALQAISVFLVLFSTRDLAVLVSFINSSQVEQAQSSVQPRSFATVILKVLLSSALPVVAHTVKARHCEIRLGSIDSSKIATRDPQRETLPYLSLPSGGPATFIVFPD